MRRLFAQRLAERAAADDRVLLLCGDVGGDLFREFPSDRLWNVGICEQAMVGMAAGLALRGFRPVVYTVTPFLIERALEQIKLDVVAQGAPVGLVGYADYPGQGMTHAALDAPRLMGLLNAPWPEHGGPHCPPAGDRIKLFYPNTLSELRVDLACLPEDRPWFLSLKKAP